jgi:hypothetical protein
VAADREATTQYLRRERGVDFSIDCPPPSAVTASLYRRHDWQLFLDISTLPQKAGCQPSDLRRVVLKELVDNAADAGGRVSVTGDHGAYVVADDGHGIDPALVPRVFSVNRPLVSSKLIRRPLRGMMGNGLRVVAGAVATSKGSLIVESKGHRLALRIDDVTGLTEVISDEPIETTQGTAIRIELGSKLRFDGSEIEFVRDVVDIAALGTVEKKRLRVSLTRNLIAGASKHEILDLVNSALSEYGSLRQIALKPKPAPKPEPVGPDWLRG